MAKQPSAKKSTAKTSAGGAAKTAAKQARTRDSSPPEFRVISESEVQTALRGRRGRRSKYTQLVTAAKDLKPGQVISVKGVAKNQVMSIRNVITRGLGADDWQVRSVKEDGADTFEVYVVRKAEM
jgi:hypothetical protein